MLVPWLASSLSDTVELTSDRRLCFAAGAAIVKLGTPNRSMHDIIIVDGFAPLPFVFTPPGQPTGFGVLFFPMWIAEAIIVVPTCFLWYRDRRTVKAGHCPTCGYDLRASKRVCPECGAAVPESGGS